MQKKWLVGGGIAAIAIALVTGQLLSVRQPNPQPIAARTSTVPTIPPLPSYQQGLEPIVPEAPLKAGDPLPPLASSPPGLVSGFSSSRVPTDSAYSVVFRPWGLGPNSTLGRTVATTVYSAEPIGKAPQVSGLVRRNILLVMDARANGMVSRGGTYAGTVTFRPEGPTLVPLLRQAAPTTP